MRSNAASCWRGGFGLVRLAVVDEGDAIPRADRAPSGAAAREARQPAIDRRVVDAKRLRASIAASAILRIVRPLQRRPARLVHADARRDLVRCSPRADSSRAIPAESSIADADDRGMIRRRIANSRALERGIAFEHRHSGRSR